MENNSLETNKVNSEKYDDWFNSSKPSSEATLGNQHALDTHLSHAQPTAPPTLPPPAYSLNSGESKIGSMINRWPNESHNNHQQQQQQQPFSNLSPPPVMGYMVPQPAGLIFPIHVQHQQQRPYVEPYYNWSVVNLVFSFFFSWLAYVYISFIKIRSTCVTISLLYFFNSSFYASIPAFVYSKRVRDANFYGRYDTKMAQKYSRQAKVFNIISTSIWGVCLGLFVLYIILKGALNF
jgi:hypothetical protein